MFLSLSLIISFFVTGILTLNRFRLKYSDSLLVVLIILPLPIIFIQKEAIAILYLLLTPSLCQSCFKLLSQLKEQFDSEELIQ